VIIGLEVHVQLATQSKLFCGCSTRFGAEPNTQTCPLCIGLPGTLPVMNRRAFELALRTATALNCEIAPLTKWDRKNYYYPDLPKGYQISQFDLPFSQDGYLEIEDPEGGPTAKRVRLIRVHLEEDAGKSMHDEQSGEADSRIDLNRTGTPLLEIVSQPDLRSPAEAKAFLTEIRLLLTYLGVSDCNMQEGSLRVDANVNLHIDESGERIATPIVEVKNMNSFRAVERALAFEAGRQWEVWQETKQRLGDVPKQTRGWDESAGVTRGQRHKEESSDYRYFPEPDLVPVTVSRKEIDEVRAQLGELPQDLRRRLQSTFGIGAYDSDVLVSQGRPLAQYYESLAEACGDGKLASNWMQQDVLRYLNESSIGIDHFPVSSDRLAELLGKVREKQLDTSRAREVLGRMIADGESVPDAMQALGIAEVNEDELVELCRALVAANPKTVADVKAGKQKAAGAFVGQAKRKNRNVNPNRVLAICLEIIEQM